MRELSISELIPKQKDVDVDKLCKALEKSINNAIRDMKPPVVSPTVTPPSVEVHHPPKEKGSYLIKVNRDNQGRIYSMVVSPYEPV